eukprot:gb/GEZN01016077.1/.p1 GENE.gb/GEZN01016077.1/~~gb/GEZN01016077.1/.p1  ORF type:complete len:213 (+),score=11.29 gb/GEZN01016077.1/:38-676(+)
MVEIMTHKAGMSMLKGLGWLGLCYSVNSMSPWIHPWEPEGLHMSRLVWSTQPRGKSKLSKHSFTETELQRQIRRLTRKHPNEGAHLAMSRRAAELQWTYALPYGFVVGSFWGAATSLYEARKVSPKPWSFIACTAMAKGYFYGGLLFVILPLSYRVLSQSDDSVEGPEKRWTGLNVDLSNQLLRDWLEEALVRKEAYLAKKEKEAETAAVQK